MLVRRPRGISCLTELEDGPQITGFAVTLEKPSHGLKLQIFFCNHYGQLLISESQIQGHCLSLSSCCRCQLPICIFPLIDIYLVGRHARLMESRLMERFTFLLK